MCAEAVWWRCHRRIIADYLLLNGRQVFHLMGERPRRAGEDDPGGNGAGRTAGLSRSLILRLAAFARAPGPAAEAWRRRRRRRRGDLQHLRHRQVPSA